MFNLVKPKLAVVLSLSVLGASHFAFAQPQPAAAPMTKTKGKHTGRKAKTGLTAKMQAKIEAALGKPLSADQKTQLDAASDTHRAAVKAAEADFQSAISRITGLSAAQLKGSRAKTLAPAG